MFGDLENMHAPTMETDVVSVDRELSAPPLQVRLKSEGVCQRMPRMAYRAEARLGAGAVSRWRGVDRELPPVPLPGDRRLSPLIIGPPP